MAKKTINLLPPQEQKENRRSAAVSQIIRAGFSIIGTLLLFSLILAAANIFFGGTIRKSQAQISSNNGRLINFQGEGLTQEIADLSETMSNYQALEQGQLDWSPYLLELARLIPPEVSLDSLAVNRAARKVELAGRAASRNAVLLLRQNILGSPYFENINFPLYNLETARNVAWKYRFYFKEHAPKPQY